MFSVRSQPKPRLALVVFASMAAHESFALGVRSVQKWVIESPIKIRSGFWVATSCFLVRWRARQG